MNSKKLILILLGLVVLGGVGVGGYRYYQATRQQLPAEERSEEPTTGSEWRVYKNEKYGFSVEVPGNWNQAEEGEYYSKGSWLFVKVKENNERLGVIEWVKKREAEYPSLYDMVAEGIPPEPNAWVAGQPAVFLHYLGDSLAPTAFLVVFTKDTNEFELEIINPEREDALEVFQHALETFRFEGEEAETKLPEFPNLEYGIKAPY